MSTRAGEDRRARPALLVAFAQPTIKPGFCIGRESSLRANPLQPVPGSVLDPLGVRTCGKAWAHRLDVGLSTSGPGRHTAARASQLPQKSERAAQWWCRGERAAHLLDAGNELGLAPRSSRRRDWTELITTWLRPKPVPPPRPSRQRFARIQSVRTLLSKGRCRSRGRRGVQPGPIVSRGGRLRWPTAFNRLFGQLAILGTGTGVQAPGRVSRSAIGPNAGLPLRSFGPRAATRVFKQERQGPSQRAGVFQNVGGGAV